VPSLLTALTSRHDAFAEQHRVHENHATAAAQSADHETRPAKGARRRELSEAEIASRTETQRALGEKLQDLDARFSEAQLGQNAVSGLLEVFEKMPVDCIFGQLLATESANMRLPTPGCWNKLPGAVPLRKLYALVRYAGSSKSSTQLLRGDSCGGLNDDVTPEMLRLRNLTSTLSDGNLKKIAVSGRSVLGEGIFKDNLLSMIKWATDNGALQIDPVSGKAIVGVQVDDMDADRRILIDKKTGEIRGAQRLACISSSNGGLDVDKAEAWLAMCFAAADSSGSIADENLLSIAALPELQIVALTRSRDAVQRSLDKMPGHYATIAAKIHYGEQVDLQTDMGAFEGEDDDESEGEEDHDSDIDDAVSGVCIITLAIADK